MSSQATGKQRAGGAMRAGHFAFIGGIGGWYPERRPEGPGDARRQFSDALSSMRTSIERAGASMANVLSVRVTLVEPETHWPAVNQVFHDLFPEPRPVCTCIGATGFRRPGQLLQVECVFWID